LNTKILLDKYNGEIEEEIDNNLKFGFWMVKLHDYDFWNSKRVILSVVGAGLTVVGLTGFYLWLRKKDKKKKNRKKHPAGAPLS
ncbi:MAG TPA: PepSY domain-containing protein, partial [Ohtaekwangia sp.]|nr:PepSY domain-containing protein [Ohtaekwangia sp.]